MSECEDVTNCRGKNILPILKNILLNAMMKTVAFLITMFFCSFFSFGQGKVIAKNNEETVLVDKETGWKYVLDKEHLYITAYNAKGRKKWRNFTTLSSFSRNKEPVEIYAMKIDITDNHKRVLYIYHTICVSYFELSNGKYQFLGCD